MISMKNNLHKYQSLRTLCTVVFISTLFLACDEEDPFVDRTVSPVLIVFDDASGYLAGGGLTAVPNVTRKISQSNYTDPVVLTASFYELDKSGILDHTVGIDSIPVANLAILFERRDGSFSIEGVTGADGKLRISTTWEALGIADVEEIVMSSAAKSVSIPLSWTGTHKGQSFTRFSQLMFVKDPD
jgi:hypothetical protein